MSSNDLPLKGITILDLSQFLSGPYCTLRLMDMGARVIKVERQGVGDLCRGLYISDTEIAGDSTLFHAINRNKESIEVNIKDPEDLALLKRMVEKVDVLIQNFRPSVIDRLGLGYEATKAINPKLVYASITGYGEEGPWVDRPGQDLLAQSRSGITWLNGDEGQGPVPFGLAIADMLAGANCAQGILAGLVKRGTTGEGSIIETSLLESLIDFQFEVLTTYFNDGNRPPKRSSVNNAHAYLSAPYGIYQTKDGYLAIAMTPIAKIADLLEMDELQPYRDDPKSWFNKRDEIKILIAERVKQQTTDHWLSILEPKDIWCANVMNWDQLVASEGFQALQMDQIVTRDDNVSIRTTRIPIKFNGTRPKTDNAAPILGAHSEAIRKEFS